MLIPKTGAFKDKSVIDRLKAASTLTEDPNGPRIFAVGPILGRKDLLDLMIETIENVGPLARNDKIVFLGNFIGSGPEADNRGVIHTLFHYEQERKEQCYIVRGKNEEAFVMSDKNLFSNPLGKNLIEAYTDARRYQHSHVEYRDMDVKEFLIARDWLDLLPYYLETKRYYLMHGGVDPDKKWEEQILKGLLYRGLMFSQKEPEYKKVVVHTQYELSNLKVDVKDNRVAIPSSTKNELYCAVLRDFIDPNLKAVSNKNVVEILKVETTKEVETVDVDQLPVESVDERRISPAS